MQPKLTFFCKLITPELQSLFSDGNLIGTLQALNAGLCLGLCDFSAERARIVRQLNDANIQLTAWLMLPGENGYWSNLDNAVETVELYRSFKNWVMRHELVFRAVGLDFEPAGYMFEVIKNKKYSRLGSELIKSVKPGRYSSAMRTYRELANQVRADGYLLETYQFPLIVDERLAKSKLIQRLMSIVDLRSDNEVLMLYSSFVRPWGKGLIWSYGKDGHIFAVGSTSNGNDLPLHIGEPITWDELKLDLLHAWRWTNQIYIYNLEGCVRHSHLEKIARLEWDQPILKPHPLTERIDRFRVGLQGILWGLTYISPFLFFGAILFILVRSVRKRETKRFL